MTEILERAAAAAVARGAGINQRTDRPSQRRNAPEEGARAAVSFRSQLQIRAAATEGNLHFVGVATAYERQYEMWDLFGPYNEVVSAGAGATSLARADLDVPLVIQHEQIRRIARTTNGTLTLLESDAGLNVDAPALDARDVDVAYIAPKIEAELVDEMSFAFRIIRGTWSPDWMTYRIDEYDIHRGDVSIVGFGANPFTSAEMRAPAPAQHRGRDLIHPDELRLQRL